MRSSDWDTVKYLMLWHHAEVLDRDYLGWVFNLLDRKVLNGLKRNTWSPLPSPCHLSRVWSPSAHPSSPGSNQATMAASFLSLKGHTPALPPLHFYVLPPYSHMKPLFKSPFSKRPISTTQIKTASWPLALTVLRTFLILPNFFVIIIFEHTTEFAYVLCLSFTVHSCPPTPPHTYPTYTGIRSYEGKELSMLYSLTRPQGLENGVADIKTAQSILAIQLIKWMYQS